MFFFVLKACLSYCEDGTVLYNIYCFNYNFLKLTLYKISLYNP